MFFFDIPAIPTSDESSSITVRVFTRSSVIAASTNQPMKDHPVPNYVRKVSESLRREGVFATAQRVVDHLRFRIDYAEILALPSAEQRFTKIYARNYWRGEESASGRGSSVQYTSNLRTELRSIIDELSIRTVFDGPCGDFNWMKEFLQGIDIDYIGGDIVQPLIEELTAKFSSPRISFAHLDLTQDPFPSADIMICRDCLFHLSYSDTESVLRNFLAVGIPYLFTSTHPNDGSITNHDIETGDFRFIDLFSAPYYFATNPLYIVDDWIPPDPEKRMCLWSRDQVKEALEKLSDRKRGQPQVRIAGR